MKKVVMMLVVALTATLVNAAAVSWQTGAMYNDTGSLVKANAKLYVYLLDAETYNSMTDVWSTYGSDVLAGGANADKVASSKSLTSKATAETSSVANTTYYAAIIATIGTGDDMKYYADKATITTGDDGNASLPFGAGIIDNKTNAATAWKSASATTPVDVPEPTSGLLLIMGGALLALRRQQK